MSNSDPTSASSTPEPCPFCRPRADQIFHVGDTVLGLWDAFPASEGHALLVTKRHVPTWWDASADERAELMAAVDVARDQIERRHHPHGYNIGVNVGEAAGQTVFHLHVHVIPRYRGDVPDPRGGVRLAIPAKGNYLSPQAPSNTAQTPGAPAPTGPAPKAPSTPTALPAQRAASQAAGALLRGPLVRGGHDPLLDLLIQDLDRARRADLAVAFVLDSGAKILYPHLEDLLSRGGTLRLLTGDYLQASEPRALRRLLDLQTEFPTAVSLHVYETRSGSFHPKAYVFHADAPHGVAYVGSSNMTRIALTHGLEWNYRIDSAEDPRGFADVVDAYGQLLNAPEVRPLDQDWLKAYEQRRRAAPASPPQAPQLAEAEELEPAPPPHAIQAEALAALAATRAEGNRAGLVVLATGLGKTWLSAFDTERGGFRRVLFVAHREEILGQALRTFRRIRPDASLGLYTGQAKEPDAEVLFASIQTLSRRAHRDRFAPNAFDYVIVDEFHHAAARTYQELIAYFDPEFMLGLTATPERADGGNLLALCDENLVYRCDMPRGIEAGLLCPFRYYGVPDVVDYKQIPWRGRPFNEDELTTHVATQARAQNAYEQWREHGGQRTLSFCCSTLHADFMADYFNQRGLRTVAVHSGETSAPRATSLEQLRDGELQVVFAVDMFNEGVDVPAIDTVLMLRPTGSRVVWLQQLGRGLRLAPDTGKTHLQVIDYIGNHKNFLLNVQALLGLPSTDGTVIQRALAALEDGALTLPPGCEVTYSLETIEVLRQLLPPPGSQAALQGYVETFRERTGVRPRAVEAYHDDFNPKAARRSHGSWLAFLRSLGALEPAEEAILDQPDCRAFLTSLETTNMTKSYKMLVLLALLNRDALPGELPIAALAEAFGRLARRNRFLRGDVGQALDDPQALQRHLEKNPIAAWTGGKGTGGRAFFAYEGERFASRFPALSPPERETFQELVRELADWRLAQFLDRPQVSTAPLPTGITVKVNHSNRKPILLPLPREEHPELPQGWTPLWANGERLHANFVKVAVNVVRPEDSQANVLADILHGWFGPDAGLPGTAHFVNLELRDGEVYMTPVERQPGGQNLELGVTYQRPQIAELLGYTYSSSVWNQGFILLDDAMVLLVTLDKSQAADEHKYADQFLDRRTFQWQSQNRTSQGGKHGQAIRHHEARGLTVHLLVRKVAKVKSKTQPFYYCGTLTFESWKGEKPITVVWKLNEELPESLWRHLTGET